MTFDMPIERGREGTAEPPPVRTIRAPVTEKMLLDWAGPKKFEEGCAVFRRDAVTNVEYRPPVATGLICSGNRQLRTSFRLRKDGSVENLCPCYDNRERGIICSHVVALGMALRRDLNDPAVLERRAEEERRARAAAAADEHRYLRRARANDPAAPHAQLEIGLTHEGVSGWAQNRIPVGIRVHTRGAAHSPEDLAGRPLRWSEADDALLYVLEDIAGGPVSGELTMGRADFCNLLELMRGRSLASPAGPVEVRGSPLPLRLRVNWVPSSGELALMLEPEDISERGRPWQYLAHRKSVWAFDGAVWRPALPALPEPMHAVYSRTILIPRIAVPRFLRVELPTLSRLLPVDSEVTADLFTIEPAQPVFQLVLRGSPVSLSGSLYAAYDGVRLVAGKQDPAGDFAIPDPADVLRYTVRSLDAEAEALRRLAAAGMPGETGDRLAPVIGERVTVNFLSRQIPALRRAGWHVDLSGRAAAFLEKTPYATPVVRITRAADERWFEVEFAYEDGRGGSLTSAEIAHALRMGDSFVDRKGRRLLFDTAAIESLHEVFEDCATSDGSRPGTFRVSGLYAAYIKSALHALDGVDIEADASWRAAVEQMSSHTPDADLPMELPAGLRERLRPYQFEGVRWLRYLEQCQFAGILADEMGLGKTIQTLAWLSLQRLLPDARPLPALIVCPTSLVDNWAEEAARFTPGLKVRILTGLDRHQLWEARDGAHLWITSYALMRRDIERYDGQEFSVVVLDEAQHIKNRTTRNAQAAKRLQARHRLVLTGTPMENSVSDLWSIMDFLMPGYLGAHEKFRHRYEQRIAAGGEEGDQAQARLRYKLQPFLLRRMKRDVARELPPKVQRVAYCTLTGDQQRVYAELLDHSRRRVTELVGERGFDSSRMEILRLLLRLRQTCCHLGLLKMEGLQSESPSGKTELLMELLQEAIG
ncbi:MAG: DEAD/DEAH box helicase family protein, partial [Kiritimatiellae bacterium]|nr:DEAD/DEAH box helicase family protein [Kiritimatiellia bacterium]